MIKSTNGVPKYFKYRPKLGLKFFSFFEKTYIYVRNAINNAIFFNAFYKTVS